MVLNIKIIKERISAVSSYNKGRENGI